MHQVAPPPDELVIDYFWQDDTIQLEKYPVLHAYYCLQESYTQNPPLLRGTECKKKNQEEENEHNTTSYWCI